METLLDYPAKSLIDCQSGDSETAVLSDPLAGCPVGASTPTGPFPSSLALSMPAWAWVLPSLSLTQMPTAALMPHD